MGTATRIAAPSSTRLHGVDVVRGLAVVGMLLVDDRGSDAIGRQLVHSPWDGLRVADLVFPVFLLVVGVSMSLSQRGQRPRQALLRGVRMTLLGWVIITAKYGIGAVGAGVLGHIAAAYLLCWLLLRLPRRAQLPVAAGALLAVAVLFAAVPPPGARAPSLTPDRSWAGWFDHALGLTFSAEAPHAYLTSAVTVFIGVLAGRLLLQRSGQDGDVRLAAWAVPLLAGGLLLAAVVPLNKRLWSPSYVLVTAGIGLLVLAATHWLVDVRGVRRPFGPFEVMGRNAIVAFAFSQLVFAALLGHRVRPLVVRACDGVAGAPGAAWAWALASVVAVWAVCAALGRRGVVVRL